MALDVRIYSSNGYLLQLADTTVNFISEGSGLGMPAVSRVFAEVWGRGHHPLVGHSYGNRVAQLTIKVLSTSLDGWIAVIQQLEQTLLDAQSFSSPEDGKPAGMEGAAAYLSVKLNGMSNATEWDILAGDVNASAILRYQMTRTASPTMIDVPLMLILKPHGRPQERVRTVSGTLNNGGGVGGTSDSVTLATPAGMAPTPLRVAVQSAAADTFQKVMVSRKTGSYVQNFVFAMECEVAAYTSYTVTNLEADASLSSANAVVATAHGGNVRRITYAAAGTGTNVALLQWAINDNLADFYGTYRVLLRVDDGAVNTTSFRLTSGGTAGTDIANAVATVASPDRNDYLVDLGRMTIPHRAGPGNSALAEFIFTLQYTFATNAGAPVMDLDCIYLMPIDEQVLDIELSAESSAQDQLVSDGLLPQPAAYLLDSSGNIQPELMTVNADSMFTLNPQEDNRFFPLMLRGTGTGQTHDLTDQLTLSFDYFPLYSLAR